MHTLNRRHVDSALSHIRHAAQRKRRGQRRAGVLLEARAKTRAIHFGNVVENVERDKWEYGTDRTVGET
jgi:hypothetical protein